MDYENGYSVGKGVVIKPSVNIKYPWFLSINDFCWIDEDVWIDNLAKVTTGKNCVLSQGLYLLTGSSIIPNGMEYDIIQKYNFVQSLLKF